MTDIVLRRGVTFQQVLRWSAPGLAYRTVTGITRAAPAVVTCKSHGLPAHWSVAITDVVGMTEVNSDPNSPDPTDYVDVTKIDADHFSVDDLDSTGFGQYVRGGVIRYENTVDLTSYTASAPFMAIGALFTDTPLFVSSTGNGRLVLDATNSTVTWTIAASDINAQTWTAATYNIYMTAPGGKISILDGGKVSITN